MRQVVRLAGVLGAVVVVVPLLAQETAAPEPNQKLIQKALSNPYLQGKVIAVDLEKKQFTIQAVIDSTKTLNKEGQARYAQIYAQALQAYRAKDKNRLDKLMPELQTAALGVYDVKEVTHNFKLQGSSDFQVRIEKLPNREGDDGKIKPYTPKELADLKGNPNLPGYKADLKQLDVELQVRAYLVPKDTKAKTPAVKKEEPPKLVVKTAGSSEKPKEEMPAADAYPISLILILPKADAPAAMPGVLPGGANPFVIK